MKRSRFEVPQSLREYLFFQFNGLQELSEFSCRDHKVAGMVLMAPAQLLANELNLSLGASMQNLVVFRVAIRKRRFITAALKDQRDLYGLADKFGSSTT